MSDNEMTTAEKVQSLISHFEKDTLFYPIAQLLLAVEAHVVGFYAVRSCEEPYTKSQLEEMQKQVENLDCVCDQLSYLLQHIAEKYLENFDDTQIGVFNGLKAKSMVAISAIGYVSNLWGQSTKES
jgi:hypothetical protein